MEGKIKSIICFLLGFFTAFQTDAIEKIILLNEGNWQHDNGRITYFEDGKVVSNKWFRDNNGYKLGDTPNDIIQINDSLIAISVNWSNVVQFITPQGKAVAATEEVPNNRKLASDGQYVYVTSYGHEVMTVDGLKVFTKGYVAKIDINNFKVVKAVEVGYEPEGIAYYKGHLFVANTGGYAFQENHDYERTVDVIDASTMNVVRSIDTGQINLYGKMSQSGQYLCINSPGDYYDIPAASVIFDCEGALNNKPDDECCIVLDYAATYSATTLDGKFYAIGSRFSYYTNQYEFNYVIIDPSLVLESDGGDGIYEDFPGTLLSDLKKLTMPYGLYVNPYTGYIYATDASDYVSGGIMHQWDSQGNHKGSYGVYINPAHFLALQPDSSFGGISETVKEDCSDDNPIYNMQGIKIDKMLPGQIYIKKGKKILNLNN